MKISIFCAVTSILLALHAPICSQQYVQFPDNAFESPEIKLAFKDEFRIDSRTDYRMLGDIEWKKGQLALRERASIFRVINGGPWTRVELRIADANETSANKSRDMFCKFRFDGATSCIVRLQIRETEKQQGATIAFINEFREEGLTTEKIIKQNEIPTLKLSELIIEYRYGMVTVHSQGQTLLTAYADKGKAGTKELEIGTESGGSAIVRLAAYRSPADPQLTVEQKRRMSQANADFRKLPDLLRQGQIDEAAKVSERVISAGEYALGKQHVGQGNNLNNLAQLYFVYGRNSQSEVFFKQSAEIYKSLLGERHPKYATTLANLAILYTEIGKYEKAESMHKQAMLIRKTALGERHLDYANSLNNMGLLYSKMGQYSDVERLFQQALEIRESTLGVKHPDYSTSLNNLAHFYQEMGQFSRAEGLYQQAIEISKSNESQNDPKFTNAINNLAMLYKKTGRYVEAEQLYRQAVEIDKSALGEDHYSYAISINNLAGLYHATGEYSRAERLYKQALLITRLSLGEQHADFAAVLGNLAGLYADLGEYARALPLYRQVLEIDKLALGEQHPDYATSLGNLALILMELGEDSEVESLLKQSLAIRKSAFGEEHTDYAAGLLALAAFYESTDQFDQAELFYQQVISIDLSILGENHPDHAKTLNNLALLYERIGKYTDAEKKYIKAIEIIRNSLGELHPNYASFKNNLAGLYQKLGDFQQAEVVSRQVHQCTVAIAEKIIPTLSDAQARRWLDENSPHCQLFLSNLRSQQKWESRDAYSVVWQTKSLVSRTRTGWSLPSDASMDAKTIFAELRDARLKLASLVSADPEMDGPDDYRKALVAANSHKEELEKKLAELNPASARELAVRDARIENLLGKLPIGVAVIDLVHLNDWQVVDKTITLKNPSGENETRDVKHLQPTPIYDAFVIRADRENGIGPARWIPLGPAEPIDQWIAGWRRQLNGDEDIRGLKDKSKKFTASPAENPGSLLRKLVWDKLEAELEGCHTVIILPDGAFNRIPWAALPGRNANSYLIEDYAIGTAAYGQQLFGILADESTYDGEDTLMIAGGIRYDQRSNFQIKNLEESSLGTAIGSVNLSNRDRNWTYLPAAAQEAKAVSNLWGKLGKIEFVSNGEANESTISALLQKSRFAHLATHGFFETGADIYRGDLRAQSAFETSESTRLEGSLAARNPLLMTGLVVAGANLEPDTDDLGLPTGSDGILTGEEIVGLDLRFTKLVTLSACETGLGDVVSGEGVFGLQRAFHQAGARSVIASLWKVDDKATQLLITEFYANLWQKKMGKLECARAAQLTMIKHYDPQTGQLQGLDDRPFANDPSKSNRRLEARYWAAFQLSGDWR